MGQMRKLRRRARAAWAAHEPWAGESGQSLFLIIAALAVILIIAALAIDVSSWYQRHHQAQVAADSAALAAANYMANGGAAPTATMTATNFANSNNLPISADNVNVDTTADNVTVTVPTHAPEFFENLFGSSGPPVTAKAVAHWHSPNAQLSLFAGNQTCGSRLGLQMASNGGGQQDASGLFSNGEYVVSSNSNHPVNGAFAHDQPGSPGYCSDNTTSVKDGTVGNAGNTAIPYPETYTQPQPGGSCNYTASYFSTSTNVPASHQIKNPGVYCVDSSFTGSSCTEDYSSTNDAGWIYFDGSGLSGSFELVAPCMSLLNLTSSITAPSGAPLAYGTSNIATAAPVSSGLPTCSDPSTASPSTWLVNGGVSDGTIYDQCGTADFPSNNSFTGFVEAENIIVEKNNTITGNGPTEPWEAGTDSLIQ
jgi:hypothetical protein